MGLDAVIDFSAYKSVAVLSCEGKQQCLNVIHSCTILWNGLFVPTESYLLANWKKQNLASSSNYLADFKDIVGGNH